MTPDRFQHARRVPGYPRQGLADEWGMGSSGGRTIRRWEGGHTPINTIAIYAIQLMLASAPGSSRQPGPRDQ